MIHASMLGKKVILNWPELPHTWFISLKTKSSGKIIGARYTNLQIVIMHALHACSLYSFGLPLRMNGMHRMQFDHVRLDFLSLIIWLRVFRLSVTWHFCKEQWWSKGLTFDCCCLHNFGNLWLFLLISNYIFKGGPIRKPYRLPWAPLP